MKKTIDVSDRYDYHNHKSYLEKYPLAMAFIISILITTIITFILFLAWSDYNDVPIIERMVDSTVMLDGYTECVFIDGDDRYTTSELPCEYKPGEYVDTKLWGNSISIVD